MKVLVINKRESLQEIKIVENVDVLVMEDKIENVTEVIDYWIENEFEFELIVHNDVDYRVRDILRRLYPNVQIDKTRLVEIDMSFASLEYTVSGPILGCDSKTEEFYVL